jgi:DNA-binding XRE family transcriptional regulator
MTTRTRKSGKPPKKVALPAKGARRTVAAKASRRIQSKAIPGLKGKGLLRIGNESKLELRDRLSMPRPLFGRVVNVSERTIAKVESETETAEKLKRPYNEVYRLLEALDDVVEVNSLGNWFREPNDAFDGLKPIEVIERGEIDRLWNMVYVLRSGMPG